MLGINNPGMAPAYLHHFRVRNEFHGAKMSLSGSPENNLLLQEVENEM